jgi:hypothetical protein
LGQEATLLDIGSRPFEGKYWFQIQGFSGPEKSREPITPVVLHYNLEQDRQCMYKVTLWRVRLTTVAMETQQ